MRIVTRPDFDGVICAALLKEKHTVTEPILWVEPSDIQNNSVNIRSGDIIANLPYHENCSLWFDHHYSNPRNFSFEGAFELAPSAARVIFEYYGKDFRQGRAEIVKETDRIDSADLNKEEVLNPVQNQYLLISMTIIPQKLEDKPYWNHLVDLFENSDIRYIMNDPQVKKRCRDTIERNETYKIHLQNHTRLVEHITVTDFRGFDEPPAGNRFLVYSLFPESIANIKLRYQGSEKKMVTINVGHSIFNRNCNVNVGVMLSRFNGGGHRGAGACNVKSEEACEVIEKIKNILIENKNNE